MLKNLAVTSKYFQACTLLENVSLISLIISIKFGFIVRYKFSELSQITGVAAILRFPMPELEDEEEEDSDPDECTALPIH